MDNDGEGWGANPGKPEDGSIADAWLFASVMWLCILIILGLLTVMAVRWPLETLGIAGFLALAAGLGRATVWVVNRNG